MWNNVNVMQKLTAVLALVGTLGMLYAGVLWVANRPWFAIHSIHVAGNVQHVNALTIRHALVQRLGGTFFTTSLNETKKQVEAIAWVRRAQITRRWPHSLLIQIEEHTPLATFNENQLVNTYGEAFTVNLDEAGTHGSLPEFSGPEGSSIQMSNRYRELVVWLQTLNPNITLPVRKLTLSDRLSWTATLASGTVLELGRDTTPLAVAERVQRLTRYWGATASRLGAPARVDLRYPDGFAVSAPGLRTLSANKGRPGT